MLAGLSTNWRTLAVSSFGSLGDDQRLTAAQGHDYSLTPGKATPRTLTRISEWTNMDGAKYTLLVEWKTNIVAKVNSYGNFGLGVEFGTWR